MGAVVMSPLTCLTGYREFQEKLIFSEKQTLELRTEKWLRVCIHHLGL